MTPPDVPPGDLLRVGEVTLDLARQVVRRGSDEIRLRPKSFDVLSLLVRHAGQVVSKQRLIETVWGDVAVTDDSLVQCLVEIRRALGDAPGAIRTIRGRGYLLDAAVEPLAREANPSTAVVPREPARAVSASAVTGRPPRPPRRAMFSMIAAMAVVAVVAAVATIVRSDRAAPGPALPDTMNSDARQSVEQGLEILRSTRAQVELQRAKLLFEHAVELDPGYAAAHAALGNSLVMLSGFGVQPPRELLPQAGRSVRQALALDPTLASAWQALAHVQTQGEWDWTAAEHSYQRAIALDPSSPFNMVFAHLLVGLGRFDEALAESDRLLAVEPDLPMRLSSNCIVKVLARRSGAALEVCDRALARDPVYSLAHFWRAMALTSLGRHDEAMTAALASRQAMGFAPTWLVGYLHARAGRLREAREVLGAMEARAASGYVPPVDIALLLAAVGEQTRSLDWLERGFRERGRWMELLAVHPGADALRGEPRFKALLAAMRLPDLP